MEPRNPIQALIQVVPSIKVVKLPIDNFDVEKQSVETRVNFDARQSPADTTSDYQSFRIQSHLRILYMPIFAGIKMVHQDAVSQTASWTIAILEYRFLGIKSTPIDRRGISSSEKNDQRDRQIPQPERRMAESPSHVEG
jgi:hypothetical protein